MKEKYQPSPEEAENAEDIMTETQRELSETRSEKIKGLQKKGIVGYVYIFWDRNIERHIMRGELDGKPFEIIVSEQRGHDWRGNFGEKKLTTVEAQELYSELTEHSIGLYKEKEKEKQISKELEDNGLNELMKKLKKKLRDF